jgi:hypothetical protein
MEKVPVFANVLWPTVDEAKRTHKGNIHLGFCATCGLVYNTAFNPSLVTYSPGYETSLHFSQHFQDYAKALAERLVRQYDLKGKDVLSRKRIYFP